MVYYFLNQNNSFVDFKHGVWLKNVKKGNGNKKTIFVAMDHVGIRFADPVQLQVQVAGWITCELTQNREQVKNQLLFRTIKNKLHTVLTAVISTQFGYSNAVW